MDLGIAGRNAIICAASSGLGEACARALAREGVNVVINARGKERLDGVAEAIRAECPTVTVRTVVGSVTEAAVRRDLVGAFDQIDILVNNAGGPPPGDFRDWDRDTWIAALDQNMLSAIELIRLTADDMAKRGFGRIVNITSSAARVPIPVIGLSNAARAGLGNFVLGLVPEFAGHNVTINNLLPGPFDTGRLRGSKDITKHLTTNGAAGRVGRPEEMGAMCAFICSQHAGYLTGQNILMDGGKYPGNF